MSNDNTLKNLRIAVTGFDGFIGIWFVKTLRSLNYSVVLLKGDVRLAETWNEKFDVLYHFAAVMPAKFSNSAEKAFLVNMSGTLNALEACRRNHAQMIFTSTCGVYKPGSKVAFSEEDELAPPTAYTRSKLMGEMLCQSFAEQYSVKSTVLRLFNVYGPGQGEGYIIPYLIKCALEGETAEVFHPNSLRDFIYITDVVNILMNAIKTKDAYSVYNVGSGQSYTISQVIEVINETCAKKLTYSQKESGKDPQPLVKANMDKASVDFEWSAQVCLKDGIQEIVSDFQNVVQQK